MASSPALRSLLLPLLLAVSLPAQQPTAADHPHWAFQPLQHEAPPTVTDPDWNQNPIDRFVRARLDAEGLAPNPPADRRTLLRRASFALTGLAPTPAAVDAFVADPSPDAFERVVDDLLASPHYGEQQARHWLDLARYSDSNGLDENLAFGNAWRYRDWVVRAHNEDMPFDRFVAMQLAGDLMADDPAVGLDGYVATGFLALGPRMLAEQDKEKLLLDTIDEQVDLVGRTFLALTLGCARCHDHKFDPIPTRDYYAMAGIFKSSKSFHDLDHVSKWFDRELASDGAIAARHAAEAARDAKRHELDTATAQAVAAQQTELLAHGAQYLLAGDALRRAGIYLEAESAGATNLHADDKQWGNADCTVLHTTAPGLQFAEWNVAAPTARRYQLAVRFAAVESRPMRVVVDGAVVAAETLGGTTGGWLPAQQQWSIAAEFALTAGSHTLRLEGNGPHVPHLDALLLTPVDGEPFAAGLLPPVVQHVAAVLANRRPDALLDFWRRLAAEHGEGFARTAASMQGQGGLAAVLLGGVAPMSSAELAERFAALFARAAAAMPAEPAKQKPAPLADAPLEAARELLFERDGLFALAPASLEPWLTAATAAAITQRTTELAALEAAVPPAAPSVMCVVEDTVHDLPVHIRGNHLTLAPMPTPRGFPSLFADVLPAPRIPPAASGRRELAAWLVAPENPLTPRVLANRIWQRAFGKGLSLSPSNFGRRGDVPVHGELLDWLAQDLRRHGWSQKQLWRRILTSRTWQQSSDVRPEAATVDPEDRWWWRQQRVRLQAESLRDAILQVSGRLDPTIGGNLLTTQDRGYVTNDQSNDAARYDAPRRSLYLPIIRNAMFDMFCAFDYVDPSVHLEQRPTSAIATQALYLLNAPFLREQSRSLASHCAGLGDDDAIRRLWREALTRAPSEAEFVFARAWLAKARDAGKPDEAMPGLAQVLFASSEFVYVD